MLQVTSMMRGESSYYVNHYSTVVCISAKVRANSHCNKIPCIFTTFAEFRKRQNCIKKAESSALRATSCGKCRWAATTFCPNLPSGHSPTRDGRDRVAKVRLLSEQSSARRRPYARDSRFCTKLTPSRAGRQP